mmetsp:Transcript_23610/g.53259  ORF Transcript_23610/g.53259 Transcript_23610/m.53259 type:complete len:201 (-) Transcript_23610:146-748(-)
MAVAAGPSGCPPSLSTTPSSRANFVMVSSCTPPKTGLGPGSLYGSRPLRASMMRASVSALPSPIALTCPKSMRPIPPSSMTMMLPGCGSPWKKPSCRMDTPNASVRLPTSFLPKSLASGPSGSIPRLFISASARVKGTPSNFSITRHRRVTRLGTARGAATTGHSRILDRSVAPIRSIASASATKLNSAASWASSSLKTV